MNAAEVTFLRAEGALRGWAMQGDAKDLYEKAVKLSFEERGATGVDTYLADALSTPLRYIDPMDNYSTQSPASTITIPWEAGDTDAVKERNLERIITQKWIAISLGIEAWSEYRRTGYPKLLPAVENKSAGTVNIKYGAAVSRILRRRVLKILSICRRLFRCSTVGTMPGRAYGGM